MRVIAKVFFGGLHIQTTLEWKVLMFLLHVRHVDSEVILYPLLPKYYLTCYLVLLSEGHFRYYVNDIFYSIFLGAKLQQNKDCF